MTGLLTRDEMVTAANALNNEAQRLENLAVRPRISASFTRPVLIARAREHRALARKFFDLAKEAIS